jgi:hypothetical protein
MLADLWHHPLGGWDDIPLHERVVFILVVVMALIVLAMIVVFTYVAVRALIDRWRWRSL